MYRILVNVHLQYSGARKTGGSSTRLEAICQGGPLGPSAAARRQQLPTHCNPAGAEEECDGLRRCEGRFRVAPLGGPPTL